MAAKREKLLWDDPIFSKRNDSMDSVMAPYAKHMLEQSGIATDSTGRSLSILDNACGNGIVTHEVQKLLRERSLDNFQITCGDLADSMLEATTLRMEEEAWSNTRIVKADAQDTQLPSDHFTHVFSNFAVMLVPKPDAMLDECHRMLRSNGICAFTTWKKVGWLDDFVAAMNSIPGIPPIPAETEGLAKGLGMGDWDDSNFIEEAMKRHKFKDVTVTSIPNTTILSAKDNGKRLTRMAVTVLTKKYWTEEQQSQYDNEALLERIENWLLSKYAAGDIEWHWIALVTTGMKY